ncbi:Alpha/beta hydrolase fold-1 [Xylaria bambusicola]|uniref:Alpha/beta hydrolase fold-1 n=1 Tax=Xylaria bambusicola TaxID=326684 RepID=UPI0020081F3A|nr:Alpha/beta hydrolase fold-1 [Xylaria bambusicola]KAI0503410.1 Alpha/beta hydrolase fold-1 [Xylaria bambusicola]
MPETERLPTIFFIPGAWHKPWVFDSVRGILSARGFETEALVLATAGSSDPDIGLQDDAAKARSALTKLIDDGKEVLVVAHSYGGIVASNAVKGLSTTQRTADGLKGGVSMVLYLAAFIITANTSLVMAASHSSFGGGGGPPDWWDISEDGKFVTPSDPREMFYHDVEPSLAQKAIDALLPMPVRSAADVSLFDPRDGGFEVGYIFAEEDRAVPIDAQKGLFELFPAGSFSASLPTSHSPFLSNPDALADTLQKAIKHLLTKRSQA